MTRALYHIDPPAVAAEGLEIEIQSRFQARMKIVAPRVLLVGMPNAGKRTAWEAVQRRREGMVKGFPDMAAYFDGRACFLEFKTRRGPISAGQHQVLSRLANDNFAVGVFRSPDTAIDWLKRQGAPFL